MKHTFAKKALLAGAIALALQTVPAQAMATAGTPPAIQSQIRQQAQSYMSWTKEALQKELDQLMKSLNKRWKNLMRCLPKRDSDSATAAEKCNKGEAAAVVAVLVTIMAVITVLGVRTFSATGREWLSQKATAVRSFAGRQAEAMKSFAEQQRDTVRSKLTPGVSRSYVTEPGAYK